MRRALTLLAALALGAAPLSGEATTVPPLALVQQARKADVIVRATLGTPTSVKEGEVTWLVYPLTVSETVAGDAGSLPQLEGRPALYLLSGLEGLPELRGGQEAFLLLYSRRLDSPIVGFWQGVYPIVDGKVTRPSGGPSLIAGVPAAGSQTTGQTTGSPAAGFQTPPAASTPAFPASSGTAAPAAPAPAQGTGAGTPSAPATMPPSPTPASPAPTSASPGTPSPATASTPVPNDPNAIETDPVKFRDALRAARGAR